MPDDAGPRQLSREQDRSPNADGVRDVLVMTGTSVLGAWMSDFMREAYSLSAPAVEVHSGDRDEVPPDLGRIAGPARVLMMIGPGRRVLALIAARASPVVVALDDPIDSVRYAMVAAAASFLHTLREQTKNASASHLLRHNPMVLLVERGTRMTAHAVMDAMMAHVGLHLEPETAAALRLRFGGPPAAAWSLETALADRVPHHAPLTLPPHPLTPRQCSVVRQVLTPLMLGALRPDTGPISWPMEVFLSGDRPDEVAPPIADVTGAARVIFYGPYFHLPPGVWDVRVTLAFSPEVRGTPFRLVVYAHEKPIAKVMIKPDGGGAFQGLFRLRHDEPAHRLEIHFMNEEGTIEGQVSLGQMTFTRPEPSGTAVAQSE